MLKINTKGLKLLIGLIITFFVIFSISIIIIFGLFKSVNNDFEINYLDKFSSKITDMFEINSKTAMIIYEKSKGDNISSATVSEMFALFNISNVYYEFEKNDCLKSIIDNDYDYFVASSNLKDVFLLYLSYRNSSGEIKEIIEFQLPFSYINSIFSNFNEEYGVFFLFDGTNYLISSNNIFFEKLSKDIKYTTPLIKTDNWVVAYAPYNLPHINFSSLYFLSITCFILVILTLITIYFLYLKNVEKPIKMTREKIEVFSKKYRINLKAKNSIEFLDNAFSTMITYLEKKNITLKKAFEKNTLLNDELEASNNQLKAQNDGLKDSFKKINVLSDKLESIVLIMSKNLINTTESFKVYFDTLLKYAIDLVPEASYGAVCFLNEDRYFDFISSIGHSLEELNKTKLIKRYELEKNKVYEIEFEDYPETVKKKLKPRTLSISSTIIVGIYDGDKLIGSLGIDSKQKIKFSEESKKILKALSNVASSYITFKNYIDLKEKFQERFISSIIYMLEKYDAYTKGHSQNVCDYALKIAKKLNLSEKEFETLKYSALLHDIGKMFIRHSILNKPDKLTKEEYEKMKQHSFYGYQVLSRSEELIDIGKIILHHHERYDGNGYPDKLSGNQIPLLSRIISVCDAYDTMVSKRIYKRSMTKQQALEELLNNSGTQFDPEIVEIFVGKVIGKALLL